MSDTPSPLSKAPRTWTMPLDNPVTVGHNVFTEIELRAPTAKEYFSASSVCKLTGEERTVGILAEIAKLQTKNAFLVDGLDFGDLMEVAAYYSLFLQVATPKLSKLLGIVSSSEDPAV